MPDLKDLAKPKEETSTKKDKKIPLSELATKPITENKGPTGLVSPTQTPLTEDDYGLFSGMDQNYTRAIRQGTGEQFAKTVGNLPFNIAAGLIENAGYLGELAGYGMKELFDVEYQADFTNAVTEFAKDKTNPFGEVYRENPNEVFDLGDPAWWLQNGGGLVESIGEFAISGAGVGKVLGTGAKAISKTINNSFKANRATRMATKGLEASAHGITSGSLGYLEGAMTGAEVYKKVIDAGMSPEDASEAASNTVKWNTALIGALNATSLYPLFKARTGTGRAKSFGLDRKAGESSKDFAERMAKFQTEPSPVTKGLYERFAIPLESGQEAIEEVTNLWAETKGLQNAGIADTDKEGMELFFELARSEEGILSAILGALGGAGQTVALDRIPFNRRAVDGEGGKEIKWLSNKQMRDAQDLDTGISYAKALEQDIREIMTEQDRLVKAIDEGNASEERIAKQNLFNVAAKRSIPIDGGEAVKASLKEIAELDNETDLGAELQAQAVELKQQLAQMSGNNPQAMDEIETRIAELEEGASQLMGVSPAMELGVTNSMDDNSFKHLAREQIEEVDALKQLYDDTIAQYNYGDEEAFNMGEYVFDIKRRKRATVNNLEFINNEVTQREIELDEVLESILPEDLKSDGNYLDFYRLKAEESAMLDTIEALKEDKKNSSSAEVRERYGVQTEKEAKETIQKQIDSVNNDLSSLGNIASQFSKELIESARSEENIEARRELQKAYARQKRIKTLRNSLTGRLNYIQSGKGRKQFLEQALNSLKKEQAKAEKIKKEAQKSKAKKEEKADVETARETKKKEQEKPKETTTKEDRPNLSEMEGSSFADEVTETEESPFSEVPTDERPDLGGLEGTTYEQEDVDDVTEVAGDGTKEVTQPDEPTNYSEGINEALDTADFIAEEVQEVEEKLKRKTNVSNKVQYGPVQDWKLVRTPSGELRKVTASNERNELREPMLESKRLAEEWIETPLTIETDFEYEGDTYDEFDQEGGEVDFDDIYNRPVKISLESGKVIGYLPTLKWLTFQENGVYVNLAPANPKTGYSPEAEIARMRAIREEIADKGSVQSEISGITQGSIIFNRDSESKRQKDKASELIPDPNANFAVVRGGTIKFPDSPPMDTKLSDGAIVMQLGEMAAPMWIDGLEATDVRTIIGAIEAIAGNEELRQQFADVTKELPDGFDFNASDGLFNLVSRKAFLSSFDRSDLEDAPGGKLFFNIDNRSGHVYLALASDNVILTTNPKFMDKEGYAPLLEDGKVIDKAREYMEEKLTISADRAKMNGSDEYVDIIYGDKVNTKSYENYNGWLKTKLSTYIDGRNTLNHGTEENPDLEYLYFQQPVVTFSDDFLSEKEVKQKEKIEGREWIEKRQEAIINKNKKEQYEIDFDDAVGEIFTIETPMDVLPEELSEMYSPLDLGDDFIIDFKEGVFNVYRLDLDVEVTKDDLTVNKEGNLEFVIDTENIIIRKPVLKDLSTKQLKNLLRLSNANLREQESKEPKPDLKDDPFYVPPEERTKTIEEMESDNESVTKENPSTDSKDSFTADMPSFKNVDTSPLAEAMQEYNVEGFTEEQVSHVTDVLVFLIGQEMKSNPDATVTDTKDSVKKVLMTRYSTLTEAENFELAAQTRRILTNFDKFYDRAEHHLEYLGYEKSADNRLTGEQSDFEKRKFDDKARWKENSKDTASSDLKMFLSSIPVQKYEGDTLVTEKSDWLGLDTYVPMDEVYDKLTQLLVDQDSDIDNFKALLEEHGKEYVPFATVLKRLNQLDDSSKIESEFVKVMSTQYTDLIISLFDREYTKDEQKDFIGYSFKPIHADRNSAVDMIFGSWLNAFKDSDLVVQSQGRLMIDPAKIRKLRDDYIEKMDGKIPGKNKQVVRELLESFGIKLSESTWDKILTNTTRAFDTKSKETTFNSEFVVHDGKLNKNKFVGVLFDSIPTEGDELVSFESHNPLSTSMTTRFRKLAYYELNNSEKIYTDSFSDINGNIIYPYQMNTQFSTTLRRVKNDEKYRETLKKLSFSKNSEWLRNPDLVTIEFIDGLKNQIEKLGMSGEDLGKLDTDLQSAVLFFGTVNQTNGDMGRYQTLTKSDKTTYPIIRAPRHEIKSTMNQETHEIESIIGKTKTKIKNIIKAEYARVYNFRNTHSKALKNAGMNIQGYSQGASHFVLNPELNAELARDYIGTAITQAEYDYVYDGETESLKLGDGVNENTINIMYKIVEHRLLEESKELKSRWEASNLLNDEANFIDTYYQKQHTGYTNKESVISYAMVDFTLNHYFSMSEEMMVLSGDPAQYWKEVTRKDDTGETITDLPASLKATYENMSKRLAKDIAPRSDGNYDSNTFRMATIQDSVKQDEERKHLGKQYQKMEIADAQEYTTVLEHITVLKAEGQISPATFNELKKVIDNAKDGYYEFSDTQLAQIMTPVKPLYTGFRTLPQYDVNLSVYTKSSSFPLLPQMVRGYELDKIRRYMEEFNVDRASFQTANKLGAVNPVKMFESDGDSVVEKNPFDVGNVVSLNRSGFGLQQEVPVKDKQEINVLSQANKLLFSGMRDIEGFLFDGEKYKGSELEVVKENIRIGLIKASEKEMIDKLGAELEDGNFVFKDLSKLKSLLVEEAKSRNWSVNAIDSIKLKEDGSGFVIPLALSPNAFAIESLLMSMVSQITLGIKANGYSYVQGSSAGLKVFGDVSEAQKSQIVPTKNYDPKAGLKFIGKDKGSTTPAQILIPWDFKDEDGNLLNIKDFTDKNGVIDDAKLPLEARRMVGARIPTQGHNSMIPLEIAGFLPPTMGTLAIVPEQIVAQMGSDFDVDKLYTYRPETTYHSKKGISRKSYNLSDYDISKAEDVSVTPVIPENNPYANVPVNVLKQKYYEVFESVYSHPDAYDKLVSPLDKPDLGEERDLISGKLTEGDRITSPASYIKQIDYRLNQRSGQQLVGIFALANTLNSLLEKVDQPIELMKQEKVDGELVQNPLNFYVSVNGEKITLSQLSGKGSTEYSNELRTKADNISLALSAAVDNANENILGNINWNRHTAGVVSTLLMSQSSDGKTVNLPWVARFTSQPAILRLVEVIEELQSVTEDYDPNKVKTAIKLVRDELNTLVENSNPVEGHLAEDSMLDMIGKKLIVKEVKETSDVEEEIDPKTMTELEIRKQLRVLHMFELLEEVSQDVQDVQQLVLSPATAGIDNNILDAIEKISDYQNFVNDGVGSLSNTESLLYRTDGSYTEQGVAAESIFSNAHKLIHSQLPEYTNILKPMLASIEEMNLDMSKKRRKKVWKGAKEYMNAFLVKNKVDDLQAERERLFFKDPLAERIIEAQNSWGKNNYFLKRLNVELTTEPGVVPSEITFSADKSIRLDDFKNVLALNNMMLSENKAIRELGEDLVLYDLITGGVQGPTNYSKYIHPAYLQSLGLGNAENMPKDILTMGLPQIIQNNPSLAQSIDTSKPYVTSVEEDYIVVSEEFLTVDQPTYLSAYNHKEGRMELFRHTGIGMNAGIKFDRVPVLGMNNVAEYYPSQDATESIFDTYKDKESANPVGSPVERTERRVLQNTKAFKAIESKLTDEVKENLEGSYLGILENFEGELNNKLADILKSSLSDKVMFEVRSIGAVARYVRDDEGNETIYLNPEELAESGKTFEEAVLHEGIHALLEKELDNTNRAEVKKLDALRRYVSRHLIDENSSKELQYAVSDLYEFTSYALTNADFQEKLNRLKFNDKTAWDRLVNLITDILQSIGSALGIEIESESVLAETVGNIVSLVESKKETDPSGRPSLDGMEGSSFEADMPSFKKDIDPVIKEAITVLNTRISTVRKNISGLEDGKKKQQLQSTLDRLEADRATLNTENNAKAVKEVAEAQAKWASAIIEDPTISDNMLFTAKRVIESWDYENTKDFPSTIAKNSPNNPMIEALRDADRIMSPIKDKFDRIVKKRIKDQINERLPDAEKIKLKDLEFIDDIGFTEEWLMDLSTYDNKLAQYIYDVVTTASRSASDELLKFDSTLTEKAKNIKDFSVFKQKDSEGNFTGEFIHEHSFEYQSRKDALTKTLYNKLRKASYEDSKKAKAERSKALKEYHEAVNELDETIDTRMLVVDGYRSPLWESKEEYVQHLKDEYGEEKAEDLINSAELQYEAYKSQKLHFEANLDNEFELAETELSKEEWKEQALSEWEARHNPLRALDEKFGVTVEYGDSPTSYKANEAMDYITSVPRKTIKGKPTGFYDSNFDNLSETERDFYDFYIASIERFKKNLPTYRVRSLKENFLPRISRDLVEEMHERGIHAAMSTFNSRMKDSISTGISPNLVESEIQSYQEIDPATGKPMKDLLGNRANMMLSDSIEIKDRGFNIPVLLRQFAGMSINYKFKSTVEDRANLGLHVLRQAKKKERKGGKTIVDKLGNLVASKDGTPSLTSSAQYFVDAMLYEGKREEYQQSDTVIFDSWNPFENNRKRLRMKEIENKRDEYERDLSVGLMSQEDYNDGIAELEEEYKELGGKNLVWGKIGDRMLELTQMKGMGWNLTAGIANVGFGLLSNITWAANGQDFTDKDLLSANWAIMKSLIPGRKDYKIANLIKKFDVLFEVTEVEYGTEADKKTKTSSKTYNFIANYLHPFEIQRRTEYAVQGMSLVAQMKNKKITVTEKSSGKEVEISLFEAFDNNAQWKDKYEVLEEWNSPSEGLQENEYTRFKNKVIQLNKYLHGNYDPNSPMQAKKYLMGRMLTQFRSWMPMGFAQRFKKEYYDRQLGRTFKGRYRTLADIGLKKSLQGLLGTLLRNDEFAYGKKGSEDRLSDVDIANIKMDLREIQILIAMIAMGVMLKSTLEDDDDEGFGSFTAHILINQLYRVEQDIYFYLSPRTFEEILKNPVPVMKTYQDFGNAFSSSLDYIMDDEYSGDSPAKKWVKAIPFGTQWVKTEYLGENLMD